MSGAVQGVGVDLVEHVRIREALERWGDSFKQRIFHEIEITYCESQAQPWLHYAGRFAVKEAVSKAMGTGIGEHLNWLDMVVEKNEKSGAPNLRFLKCRDGVRRDVLISLSHTEHYSVAQAVIVEAVPDSGSPE
jgi:holo-[acyl-carrier protein] synthase